MKDKQKVKEKKRKTGRPKGTKNKLPFTTFTQALDYAKKFWKEAQGSDMSFDDIVQYTGFHEKKVVRILNALRDAYKLVEKTDSGEWVLTNIGKGVAVNNSESLKEMFISNSMFKELHTHFGNRNVTESVIQNYVKKHFKGVNSKEATKRYFEGLQIIKTQGKVTYHDKPIIEPSKDIALHLFQLKYALHPASHNEIETLAETVAEKLNATNDESLKLLSEFILEKKGQKDELIGLVNRVMKKLSLESPEKHRPETEKKKHHPESKESDDVNE